MVDDLGRHAGTPEAVLCVYDPDGSQHMTAGEAVRLDAQPRTHGSIGADGNATADRSGGVCPTVTVIAPIRPTPWTPPAG